MNDWLTYVLLLAGVMYLVTQSTIFAAFRIAFAHGSMWRASFIYCPACVGFWTGLALGNYGYWPPQQWGMKAAIESAFAAMALGAVWGTWFGSEATLEGELPQLEIEAHDQAQEAEDG